MNILEEFRSAARSASSHYAVFRNWIPRLESHAREQKAICRKLYEDNQGLRTEMRAIMQGELWGREFDTDIAISTWVDELSIEEMQSEWQRGLKWMRSAAIDPDLRYDCREIRKLQAIAIKLDMDRQFRAFLQEWHDQRRKVNT